jgi:hypothetical protein
MLGLGSFALRLSKPVLSEVEEGNRPHPRGFRSCFDPSTSLRAQHEMQDLWVMPVLDHCTPDEIIGYDEGRGIAIHRQDCENILRLPAEKHGLLIDVAWGTKPEAFPVEIEVRALDRIGEVHNVVEARREELG